MSTDLLAHTRDAFNSFRVESIWLRTVYDMSTALYSSDTESGAILRRTAPLFFSDLNSILVEYWVLIVCRITDPATTMGRENLTVQNLIACLNRLGLLTGEIQREADGLQAYRNIVNTARNRIVSHADKQTFLKPELLGEHDEGDLTAFLQHLQRFNDLVGEVVGEGPLDFSATSAPGDVYDLLRALRNAT